MAIRVATSTPNRLLAAIKKAIDDCEIQTWAYDDDGDFTHSATQWNRQAWLHPAISTGELTLTIIAPQDTQISKEIYGIYHGRFIEMLLVHFDESFSDAHATAMPIEADLVIA